MKKLIQKSGAFVLSLFVVILIIILGVQAYNKFVIHDVTANIFGFNYKTVLTGSMEPTLPVGSMAFTKEQDSYNVNDIVMFKENGEIITHRIIESGNGYVITKGDANNAQDDEITEQQIMGKVILKVPYIGYLYIWLQSPIGILCIFAVCVIWYTWIGRKRGAEDETEKI